MTRMARRSLLTLCTLLALGALAACGRSSPEVDFCKAREGLACAALATERAAEEAEYTAALSSGDAELVDARGDCVQEFVAEQLEDGCLAVEPSTLCREACALHPCGVRASDGTPDASGDCISRCVEEASENAITLPALQRVLERAAGTPGLCTCRVCDPVASAALCDELWVCN